MVTHRRRRAGPDGDVALDAADRGRGGARRSRAMNQQRLEELESERQFLLQSLRDLDAEHDAGDVDEHDYATLRDGYTSRAAAVLHQLEADAAPSTAAAASSMGPRRPVGRGRRRGCRGGGWWVAHSSGQRLPGDEISGGVGDPDSVTALLSQARAALADGDAVTAVANYQRVLDRNPKDAEALTYSGWLLFIGSADAAGDVRADAVSAARQQLDAAVVADPSYADPHCFLAVIAANTDDASDADLATARDEGERCLALDPPADARALVTQFLAGISDSSTPPSSTP